MIRQEVLSLGEYPTDIAAPAHIPTTERSNAEGDRVRIMFDELDGITAEGMAIRSDRVATELRLLAPTVHELDRPQILKAVELVENLATAARTCGHFDVETAKVALCELSDAWRLNADGMRAAATYVARAQEPPKATRDAAIGHA